MSCALSSASRPARRIDRCQARSPKAADPRPAQGSTSWIRSPASTRQQPTRTARTGADDEPGTRLRLPDCRVRLRRQRIGAAPGREGLSGSRFGVRASFRGPRLRRAALAAAPDDLCAEAGLEGHSAGDTVQRRHGPQRKWRGRRQPCLRADPLARRRRVLRGLAQGMRRRPGSGEVLRVGRGHARRRDAAAAHARRRSHRSYFRRARCS